MQRSRPPILAATGQLTNLTVPTHIQHSADARATALTQALRGRQRLLPSSAPAPHWPRHRPPGDQPATARPRHRPGDASPYPTRTGVRPARNAAVAYREQLAAQTSRHPRRRQNRNAREREAAVAAGGQQVSPGFPDACAQASRSGASPSRRAKILQSRPGGLAACESIAAAGTRLPRETTHSSCRLAHRELVASVTHRRSTYLNRAENSHQPTRVRERVMKRFASPGQAQRFLFAFGNIRGHFRPRRHLISASQWRTEMRDRFAVWREITAAAAA
jgi:hypothetical protein